MTAVVRLTSHAAAWAIACGNDVAGGLGSMAMIDDRPWMAVKSQRNAARPRLDARAS